MDGIQHRAGIEVVLSVHVLLLRELVVVLPGAVGVPEYQVRLGDDPGEPVPAFGRGAPEYHHPLVDHIAVVPPVELAVHYVEIGEFGEARVGHGKREPGLGLLEAAAVVVYHAGDILARGSELRIFQGVKNREELQGFGVAAYRKGAISALEHVFGHLRIIQRGRWNLGEFQRRLAVLPLVEQDPGVLEAYPPGQRR